MLYTLGVLAFAIGLLASIALHEIGHMVPAKAFGVKVTQYMVGFGPTLWSTRRGDTEYGFKAVPLGGYIRMVGMIPPRQDGTRSRWPRRLALLAEDFRNTSRADVDPADEPREFYRLAPWKKIIVMVGGPSMNLLIYLVLTVILLTTVGLQHTTNRVVAVERLRHPGQPGHPGATGRRSCPKNAAFTPASKVLKSGDRILAIGTTPTKNWSTASKILKTSIGKPLTLTVLRAGQQLQVSITPVRNLVYSGNSTTPVESGYLGVELDSAFARVPLTQIPGQVETQVGQGFKALGEFPTKIGSLFGTVFEGHKRDPNGAVGVVGLGPDRRPGRGQPLAAHGQDRLLAVTARVGEPAAVPVQPGATVAVGRRSRRRGRSGSRSVGASRTSRRGGLPPAPAAVRTLHLAGWSTSTRRRWFLCCTEWRSCCWPSPRSWCTPTIVIEQDFKTLLESPDVPLPVSPIKEDDPFMLIFTSGTTGRPKAAVLSHRSVIGYLMLQSFLGLRGLAMSGRTPTPPPVRLAPYPLFHVSGLSATVSTMMGAGTTVWPLGRFDPESVIELTKREGIRVWNGASTHVLRLLGSPAIDTIDPTQIVQVGVGGSATTPALVRRTEQRFPHLANTVSTGYGSTETGGLVSWAPNWMLQEATDCVGPALPTVSIRITDDDGEPVAEGVEGNVEARSPIVMLGYWDNDAANAETMRPGSWIRTGDFGRHEGGLLYLASRKRDLILRGGENIYPFEIENRIDEHPDVVEVSVIGAEHPVLGQEVKAVIVVREGAALDADQIRAWCAQSLAAYKVPALVELRTAPLPRNATGKVMKHLLADESGNIFVEE